MKASPCKRKKGGGRKPAYAGEFAAVLRNIRVFFRYRCGKILAPFIRGQIKHLEKPFHITKEVRQLLLSASPATIDRKLKADKRKLAFKGKCGTKPGNLLKKQIPIRTYYAGADKKPGFFETDTARRCGTSEKGEFCPALSAADVYSGRAELRALLNKAEKWVLEALPGIKSSLPFPFLGMDSDNGSEFINKPLLKWCSSEGIRFTRSRPYRKHGNCYVEQKNNSRVRNFTGYYRFSSPAGRGALAAVCRPLCPLLNYFMPAQKLLSKTRVGSIIKKVYDKKVLSPYQRLLVSPDLSDDVKQELANRYKLLNPVKLQRDVREAVDALMSLHKAVDLEGGKALALSALYAV
jgi:hypothetical protein